ncbi:MAG: aldehyde dehydrogenase family protein [Candidatus Brocadiaceae bacterium]|jgi:acyl-CoA reductase-like NAD-dependent aldehyde dehydrogenase
MSDSSQNLSGGKSISSVRVENATDVTGEVVAEVNRARRAQSAWAATPVRARLKLIRRLRQGIAAHADRLAAAVDRTRRRAPGETLAAEVLPLAEACRFLERRAVRILRPHRASGGPLLSIFAGVNVLIRREPYGVVLVVGPSNYPLLLPGVQGIQALAAGNAVVLKPGAGGREALELLAQLLYAAGLRRNLCRVLPESVDAGRDAISAGVDRVVLTGSVQTGRSVLAQLAPRVVPATLELSGCDAVFVLPGADLELVAKALTFGLRLNQGATCIAPRRVFVTPAAARELESRLGAMVAAAPACSVDEAGASFARGLVREALAEGARLVTGPPASGGLRWPLVLGDALPAMRLLQEDVFAPALSIVRVSDPDEALAADEACPYALGATVFGPDAEARRFAERVNAGVVVVNDMIVPTADPRVPFGGRGRSGYGVTRGAAGLLELTRQKAIVSRRGGWRPHLDVASAQARDVLQDYMTAVHGGSLTGRMRALGRLIRHGASMLHGDHRGREGE